ncbi:short-chain dehydrogenase/reductase [Venturia nashicola]|uniref:Short-chain dehydrogenase/reductase n=1 Tax=Venturia nashicola TaxID=86259 RepID=A0A4Z1P4Y9_9PEZI|nr:short-chain dehydrogenase/reductase [Venturia nashicola]TLD23439.1 short-chain dehydrogenase/reductase [Venturia nashicola]
MNEAASSGTLARLSRLPTELRELLILHTLVPATLISVFWRLLSFTIPLRHNFRPETSIPALTDKVILVTGGNAGIGRETVLQLAKHNPSKIIIAARDEAKASEAIRDIENAAPGAQIMFISLDLMSFESIRQAVDKFNAHCSRLDILVNNAGIMATPSAKTKEGYEAQFGTNHLGHALLTKLLLPTLVKTAALPDSDVRIINVSSIAQGMAPPGGIIFDTDKLCKLNNLRQYGQSKLANVLFTKGLAKRYPQIRSVAVHPGLILTDLYLAADKSNFVIKMAMNYMAPLFFQLPPEGAYNQLWAATALKSQVANGAYYLPVGKIASGSSYVKDEDLVERLWEWTEDQFEEHGC